MNNVPVIDVGSNIVGNPIGINLIVDISKRTACSFYCQPLVDQAVDFGSCDAGRFAGTLSGW